MGNESGKEAKAKKLGLGTIVAWVFFVVLVVSAILSMLEWQVAWISIGIVAIVLAVYPAYKEKDYSKMAPAWIMIIMSAGFLLHWTQGGYSVVEMGSDFLKTAGILDAVIIASIAFLLVLDLEMYTDLQMNRPVAAMFVIMFTMAVTGVLLVVVWLADVMYEWPTKLFDSSPSLGTNYDVMIFILYASLGGLIMAIVYSIYTWLQQKMKHPAAKEVAA